MLGQNLRSAPSRGKSRKRKSRGPERREHSGVRVDEDNA